MIFIPSPWLLVPALCFIATGGILVVVPSRRIRLGALLAQFVCAALLLTAVMPLRIVLIKAAVGVMTTLILYVSDETSSGRNQRTPSTSAVMGARFRLLAYCIFMIAAYGVYASQWIQLPLTVEPLLLGAILLIGSGLFQIGVFPQSYAIGCGMLTFVMGFDVIYTVLEPSLAMVALLAAVHIGLALVVSYLELIVPAGEGMEEREA